MLIKLKRILPVLLSIILVLTTIPIQPVFAGEGDDTNVDTGDADGSGAVNADDKPYGYWTNPMGIRVSIYWAPAVEGARDYKELAGNFAKKDGGVQRIGTVIDLVKGTKPYYDVVFYSNKSIYDYMQGDSYLKTAYKSIMSESTPYSFVGTNSTKAFTDYNTDNGIESKDDNDYGALANSMPNPKTATAEQWENWFTGSTDPAKKTYVTISKLTEMCGKYISPEDIKAGIYKNEDGSKEGVYKVFFEPLASAKFGVAKKGTFWTLRDAIKYGMLDSSRNNGNNLDWQVTYIKNMFEYLGNLTYLRDDEPALHMYANTDSYQIDVSKQSKSDIINSLKSGAAWKSLGVGTISPQRDNFNQRIQVVVSYVQYQLNDDGTVSLKECMPTDTYQMSTEGVVNVVASDKVKVGDYGVGYLNDIVTSSMNLLKDESKITWEEGLPSSALLCKCCYLGAL